MLVYLMKKIDRPRSIYSKTVNGMPRKDMQLGQLRHTPPETTWCWTTEL